MKAVILCAGMGTRMYPFTKNIHKSMVKVQGKPIIERTIEYLKSKDINDITIVVGYKAEQFEYLKSKYDIETSVSTKYETHNNYTSMQLVLDKLDDCLVLEGDFYILEDFVEQIDKSKNQYLSQEISYGSEWQLITDENDRIIEVKTNKTSGWGLVGISYWKGDITVALEEELNKCGQNEYWDDAVFRLISRFDIYANKFASPIVYELDRLEDIIHYNIMTHDDIIEQCSSDGIFEKIDNNTYIVDGKTFVFENNNIVVVK